MLSVSIKILLVFSLLFQVACEEVATVSILEETDVFEQNTSSFDNKIDILWVVDNSGSMANLQANVAANFESFISQFAGKNYDFQMAVTTTDAWLESKGNNYQNCGQTTGISAYRANSGYAILTPNTPNLADAFIDNISQGVEGCGDERAFSSMIEALGNPDNIQLGFPRADAFLAVIIVSDEDDFSHDDGEPLFNDHNDPRIHDVSLYDEALQIITGSNSSRRTYNVSSIAIFDQACVEENDPWGVLATRYESLVDTTDGVKASVCANDFSSNLEEIQQKIVVLSTQFFLSREPIEESIVVMVDSEEIQNDPNNGWTYNKDANSIMFHGEAVPNQGADIEITFDPVALKN
jgi:hypothetical protein